MKKLYISIITAFLFCAAAVAQPTFTSSNMPPIGSTTVSHQLDTTGVSPGNAGANQTWNFAAVPATGLTQTGHIIDPSTTTYGSSFPTATHASQNDGSPNVAYLKVTSADAELIGFVGINGTVVQSLDYSDPEKSITFPFTYQTTFTDSYTAFASYMYMGYQFDNYRYGSVTTTGDGYGNVTTPVGTFNNVLRVLSLQTITDSLVALGSTFQVVTTTTESYSWNDPALVQSLMYIAYITQDVDGIVSYANAAMYSDASTGISESTPMRPLEIYPNPSVGNSIVHLTADDLASGATSFIATDITGRIVKKIDFTLMPASHKSVDIDMSDCPNGIYMIQLQQNNTVFATKFVKQ